MPVFGSLRGYRRAWLAPDLTAGALIAAISIPLSMGMAEVAGMPPVTGLYSCIVPMVAYAALGSSPRLVVALDASTAALIGVAVAEHAGSDPALAAAVVATIGLLAGGMLLLAGLLRLGSIASLLSEPVLLGYQAGLAVVVVASQLERMTGIAIEATGTLGQIGEALTGLGQAHAATLAIAVGTLALAEGLRWRWPTFPAALVALVAATLVVAVGDLQQDGVAVLGTIPSGLPPIGFPDLGGVDVGALVGTAGAIALLAGADTLVASRAFAARGGYRVAPSRDLVGLGAANLGSAVTGGLTVSASAARTAVADTVGSRSQAAQLTAAAVIVFTLVALTGPMASIPLAALGAIVTGAVARLVDLPGFRGLWRTRRIEFVIAVVAAAGVIALGVLEGVLVAIGLSLVEFVLRQARPADAVLGDVPGRQGFHDVGRDRRAHTRPGTLIYRFDAPLFYANAERFRARVEMFARRARATRVVIDAAGIAQVDASGLSMLRDLVHDLDDRGITMVFADPVEAVADALRRADEDDERIAIMVFDTIDEAVAAIDEGGTT